MGLFKWLYSGIKNYMMNSLTTTKSKFGYNFFRLLLIYYGGKNGFKGLAKSSKINHRTFLSTPLIDTLLAHWWYMQNHNYSAKKTFPVASSMGRGKLYMTQNINFIDNLDILGIIFGWFHCILSSIQILISLISS